MAPPTPAMPAERAKMVILARAGLMPMVSAATWLPRMAERYLPTVPLRTRITTTAQTANTAMASRKKARLPLKPGGRGTFTPVSPLPSQLWGKSRLLASRAKARVARAR